MSLLSEIVRRAHIYCIHIYIYIYIPGAQSTELELIPPSEASGNMLAKTLARTHCYPVSPFKCSQPRTEIYSIYTYVLYIYIPSAHSTELELIPPSEASGRMLAMTTVRTPCFPSMPLQI